MDSKNTAAKQRKILLVEDDSFLSEMYYLKLKNVGYMVEVAYDGEIALEKVKRTKPDLVLLDLRLPKLSGFEVLKQIKNDKNLNYIPVIVLSNLGEKEDIQKALELGATDYLIKAHFTPTEVLDKIVEILEGPKQN